MIRQIGMRDVFQRRSIHQRWESVYRRNRIHSYLSECTIDRLIPLLHLRPGDRVLDAGCGTGEHTLRFAQRGFHCVGIDISDYAVKRATRAASALDLAGQASFACGNLSDMEFSGEQYDAIHCRGVLMHLPDYRPALHALCSMLKPGGRLVIIENNHHSVETMLVRMLRRFHHSISQMVFTEDGIEFRCPRHVGAPMWRVANMKTLAAQLRDHGVHPVACFATEFWDLNRFPAGLCRNAAALWDYAWFTLHLPARLSLGNAIVAERREG